MHKLATITVQKHCHFKTRIIPINYILYSKFLCRKGVNNVHKLCCIKNIILVSTAMRHLNEFFFRKWFYFYWREIIQYLPVPLGLVVARVVYHDVAHAVTGERTLYHCTCQIYWGLWTLSCYITMLLIDCPENTREITLFKKNKKIKGNNLCLFREKGNNLLFDIDE